ncbi:MAG: hypothetical protein S0880_05590 [Actinomycetota bacterium]|nr:hypothetical protein [Actinomycetota bacterium]
MAPEDGNPAAQLPRHSELIERLRRAVEADDEWRTFEVGCSIGRGTADELSDIDAAIGYATAPNGTSDDERLRDRGRSLVDAAGTVVDVLCHREPAWPPGALRFAAEYGNGVQLDLVVLPAARRPGLPDGSVAIVDKDGVYAQDWRPPVADPPDAATARQWTMLGWWLVSDAAKYLRRGSWFEAEARITDARAHALRLHAAARRVPYPSFGLVSLLDFPPFELPDGLGATYANPTEPASVLAAAEAVAALLRTAAADAGGTLGVDLSTPWSSLADQRLAAAGDRRTG